MKEKQPEILEAAPELEAMPLARRDEHASGALIPSNIEGLFRLAIENKSAVDVIERLSALQEKYDQKRAKSAFDLAMAAFQSECPVIKKDKFGAQEKYKYAPLDSIITQVRDLLQKHGFSYTVDSVIELGWVKAICKVTHEQGHSQCSEFKVPIDKRATLMNEPQQYASALTFSKRYAFCNAFGILTGDEDRDGAGNRAKPKGPSTKEPPSDELRPLATELWTLLTPVRGVKKDWVEANKWLWQQDILDGAVPEEAPNLKPDRFKAVIAAVKAKLPK